MKSITFTVEIQADCPDRVPARKATAIKLCDDINNILAIHEGETGGAQIFPEPRNIKVTTTPDD
jgi:hypothetical protein